jgi:hypothetical protein
VTAEFVPHGLGPKASKLWEEITERHELRPDEARILEDACRQADIVERIEKELSDGALTARGSQGQPVPSPLLTEVRQHRSVLAALLKQLKIPEDVDTAARNCAERSEQARKAARARWGVRGA